jgi:hypothetical protein
VFYSGGGGGHTGGVGGTGGGGNGSGGGAGGAGTANSGGGGGGGRSSGGNGGSGIIIIRYPDTFADATTVTGSPVKTDIGGYKIYRFNASGTIAW